ncbi:uncharacterized protein MELLADRAFT_117746 [Melampsora larici-populina 98AG31]|uniref:Family 25 glycosyltransferase n=1 Tax=Melampsora larici-populina (strain 98AG31 / pathotype 3-4-7) TaxID=747676 RepID=F4S124_MELLP|nr:uncharacterized protein MELLADRAFT_117746 [Melampsora larici-populina 98AG31]EGG01695.1 hypothetical protein MELLADRAFT_117746 [Melampsora larici-populina 98AG31]
MIAVRLNSILRNQFLLSLRSLILLGILFITLIFLTYFKSNQHFTKSSTSSIKFQSSFLQSTSTSDDISFNPNSIKDASLNYRRFLELTTSPSGFNQHHPTLGFDHIYCISLPERIDRRITMKKIANALGIEITFINATSKDSNIIKWISEKAYEIRKEKIRHIKKHTGMKSSQIGGMGVESIWLTVNEGKLSNQDSLKDIHLPDLDLFDKELNGMNWLEYLWSIKSEDHSKLKPKNPNFNVTESMWDFKEKIPQRQINSATVSTFYNHLKTIRMIKESGDKSALVLEDDVDLEWDLERRWRTIERRLPKDWETVFLGHCWGKEIFEPQVLHPNLHKSTSPLCLHGYAVSSLGATKLLSLFNDPWISFQTPIDTCIPTFIKLGLKSYSIEPPIINQSKILKSDIQIGKGSKWKGFLADSVLERIYRSEGVMNSYVDNIDDSNNLDPATIFRWKTSSTNINPQFIKCNKKLTQVNSNSNH